MPTFRIRIVLPQYLLLFSAAVREVTAARWALTAISGNIWWQSSERAGTSPPWLRLELAAHYRPNMVYSGTANFLNVTGPQPVSTSARSIGLMINGYLELDRFTGLADTIWHPYVGAGLGFSRNRLEKVDYRFPEASVHTQSITPSGRRLDGAFMLSCGAGLEVSPGWLLDFMLRYEDLGSVETGQGPMYLDHIPEDIEIAETSADLRGWGGSLGLRYQF